MAGTAALGLSRELRTRPIRNRPRTSRWGRVEHEPVATSSTYVEPPRQAHSPRATSCRNSSFTPPLRRQSNGGLAPPSETSAPRGALRLPPASPRRCDGREIEVFHLHSD